MSEREEEAQECLYMRVCQQTVTDVVLYVHNTLHVSECVIVCVCVEVTVCVCLSAGC